jgi:predicted transcriptional regulator
MADNARNRLNYSKDPLLESPPVQEAALAGARKVLELPQRAMATTLGISLSQWGHYESGTKTTPNSVLMAVSYLLATSESGGLESVAQLISEQLASCAAAAK